MGIEELEGLKRRWGKRLLATGRIATSAAQLATRRVLGSEGPQDGELGMALARELDQMKGMAMKVGQIISYFDGILPEETHAALQGLQKGHKPVAYARMMEVLEAGLGGAVDTLFEDFAKTPVAAASIGQVYRAKVDGREVAVKVQYPGVLDTIQSDFSLLNKISRLASLATAVDGPAIVGELRKRFGEECDYMREAAYQEAFAEAFADEEAIRIPKVIHKRTCPVVLTSEWCPGKDFYSFQEAASQERRNEVGMLLTEFAYQSFYRLGVLNADPHPGNYLFPDDGPVVFLDFGCVKRFDPDFIAHERHLAQVVTQGHREEFRDALLATQMVPNSNKFDFGHHWAMLRHQYAPYCTPHFRFTTEYIQQGMEFSRPSNPNLRHLALPPAWIWLMRLQWGLHAVLARLQAEGPFATLFQKALDTPLQPLALSHDPIT